MKENPVTIMLSKIERDLISQHAYPFEEIEAQLDLESEADLVSVTDAPFWWEQIIVNLHISETEPERADVSTQLRLLISRIITELKLTA